MNKAAFLDRDGVINVDKGYLFRIEDFEYISGAIDGMKKLMNNGYILVVITNQSGIARGFFTEDDFNALNSWMINDLHKKGVIIQKTYYCPHHEEAVVEKYRKKCECRKPGIELFMRAQKEFDIDMNRSIAIGDSLRDLSICKTTGVKGVLLNECGGNGAKGITICNNWDSLIDVFEGRNN